MAKKPYTEFRGLLRGAICTRTQAQFAVDSGISAEHLSRMLNLDEIHRPNRTTLAKIAAAAKNGVTLQDLADALDREDGITSHASPSRQKSAREDFAPEFRERAEATMAALCRILASRKYPEIAGSVMDYIDGLSQELARTRDGDMLPLAWEAGRTRRHFGKYCGHAEKYVPVYLSMSDGNETAESVMMIYFGEIPGPDGTSSHVIHCATCAVEALEDQYGTMRADLDRAGDMLEGRIPYPEGMSAPEFEDPDPEQADPEAMRMALSHSFPYSLDLKPAQRFREKYRAKGRTPEERLLNSIFGNPVAWAETVEGIGFWLEDVPARLPEFAASHRQHILDAYDPDGSNDEEGKLEELEKILDIAGHEQLAQALDGFNYQDPDCVDDEGWGSAVATVMRAETGFMFKYLAPAGDTDVTGDFSEHGCIILADADRGNVQREAALNAAYRYARALGLKEFGDILFTGLHRTSRTPMTYIVKDQPAREDEAGAKDLPETGVAYVPFSKDGLLPQATGRYMARLKDGRELSLVWLDGPDLWIRAHKEWSSMVEAFCPDPLPPLDISGKDGP